MNSSCWTSCRSSTVTTCARSASPRTASSPLPPATTAAYIFGKTLKATGCVTYQIVPAAANFAKLTTGLPMLPMV